jgi:hypothetical protein
VTRSAQDRAAWSAPTTTEEAHARAAGRRRYNSLRRLRAELRRVEVLRLLAAAGGLHRGVQVSIARQLNVSEATISRDLRGILGGVEPRRCPLCYCGGHMLDGQLQLHDSEDLDLSGLVEADRRLVAELAAMPDPLAAELAALPPSWPTPADLAAWEAADAELARELAADLDRGDLPDVLGPDLDNGAGLAE